MKHGPNVKALIVRKMATEAVPARGDIGDGIRFMSDPDRMCRTAASATDWVMEAIRLVCTSGEPNPFRDADDETIAGEILRQMAERKD